MGTRNLTHADAAGHLPQAGNLADHVRHGSQLLAAQGAGLDDLGRELEPVDHGLGQAGRAGTGQVEFVGGLQAGDIGAQQPCQTLQRRHLGGRTGPGHVPRGSLGLLAQGVHEFGGVAGVHVVNCLTGA